MTHKFLSLLLMVSVVFAVSAKNDRLSISSPDDNISVKIDLDKQRRVYYSVTDGTTQILDRSRLGLKLKDVPEADHATNPTQIIIEQKKVDNDTVLSIPQARSGGAAIKIAKIK